MLAQISSDVRKFKVLVKDENEAIKRAIEVAGGRPYKLELWIGHEDVAGKPPAKVIEQDAFPFVESTAQRFTILFGALDNDTLEIVWDEDGTGTYKTREDAEFFAGQYRKDGQVYEIKERGII